jgi:outer membrane lipoprotein carrier protein
MASSAIRAPLRAGAALAIASVLGFATAAQAGGPEQLRAFLDGARQGKAAFRQVVAAKNGRRPQESSGTFAFARPGKFRWSYEKPVEQLIVGDGERVWVYDRDLNQVIVRRMDQALGASPAALLAGNDALEKNFDITDAGNADGLEYVEARPKSSESGFERVRIGFRDNLPRAMELTDSFGNVTTLTFGSFERNPALDAAQFRFAVPKGADVVGDTN